MDAEFSANSKCKLHGFRDDFIKQDYLVNTEFDLVMYDTFIRLISFESLQSVNLYTGTHFS